MNHKALLTLFALLLIFASCKKSEGPSGPPPESEPLNIAAAKPGDTLYIKGENFSEDIAKNIVQINGVTATVVVASATELKVVIPASASTGAVTVTINGQTVEAGTLTIVPPLLFVYKRDYQNSDYTNYPRQIFTIDPATGHETLLYTRTDTLGSYFNDPIYLPATNEIIGVASDNNTLIRLNITTKQASYITLGNNPDNDFRQLVADKFSNLYAIKRDWSNPNHYMQSLVKVDPKTGKQETIKTIEYGSYLESLVYLPSENKVMALADGGAKLLGINLTTKEITWTTVSVNTDELFWEMAVDNQGNLYGFKTNYANGEGQFHKLNPTTGETTLLHSFTNYSDLETNLAYLPHRNELVAVWDINKLYRFNLTSKTTATLPLTTNKDLDYGDMIVN